MSFSIPISINASNLFSLNVLRSLVFIHFRKEKDLSQATCKINETYQINLVVSNIIVKCKVKNIMYL